MSIKKSIWIVLTIVSVAGLAACSGGGNSGSASEPAGAAAVSMGDADAGKEQYDVICIACHGPGGEGIENLGKPFTTSEFLREKSDKELVEFIKVGRPSGDPLNTTGIDMPPKGGNPALTDDQILDIIAYVRTLQE